MDGPAGAGGWADRPELAATLKAEAQSRVEAHSFFGHVAYASLTARKPRDNRTAEEDGTVQHGPRGPGAAWPSRSLAG